MKSLGLVGVGAWGRRYVEAIARRDDCRVAAYARASSTAPDAISGARRCASWHELLELARRTELDGIIVAATPDLHVQVAEAAVEQNIPILVEKPLGLSPEAVRRIWQRYEGAARRAPAIVDYIHLWAPAYRALKARVLQLETGAAQVAAIETAGFNKGPYRGWSSLYDYGPHDLSMCLDLLGVDLPFVLRDARRDRDSAGGEIFECQFDLGTTAVSFRVGNGEASKRRLFAVTLVGGRRLSYDDLRSHPYKIVDQESPVPIAEGSPLDEVLSHFLSLLDDPLEGSSSSSLALSVRILEILATIDRATAAPVQTSVK